MVVRVCRAVGSNVLVASLELADTGYEAGEKFEL
jgi:hypothetical protein